MNSGRMRRRRTLSPRQTARSRPVDFMHRTDDRAAYYRGENYTVAELALPAAGRRCASCCPTRARALRAFLRTASAVGGLLGYDMGAEPADAANSSGACRSSTSDSDLELTDALQRAGRHRRLRLRPARTSRPSSTKTSFDESGRRDAGAARRARQDRRKGLRGRGVHGHHGGRHHPPCPKSFPWWR